MCFVDIFIFFLFSYFYAPKLNTKFMEDISVVIYCIFAVVMIYYFFFFCKKLMIDYDFYPKNIVGLYKHNFLAESLFGLYLLILLSVTCA